MSNNLRRGLPARGNAIGAKYACGFTDGLSKGVAVRLPPPSALAGGAGAGMVGELGPARVAAGLRVVDG